MSNIGSNSKRGAASTRLVGRLASFWPFGICIITMLMFLHVLLCEEFVRRQVDAESPGPRVRTEGVSASGATRSIPVAWKGTEADAGRALDDLAAAHLVETLRHAAAAGQQQMIDALLPRIRQMGDPGRRAASTALGKESRPRVREVLSSIVQ